MVELVLDVEPPDKVIATSLADHLRAELVPREIDVCVDGTPGQKPVARVKLRVERMADGRITARIEIGDEITDKRVERTIPLEKLPEDARPLMVAAATDELLRASWIELSVNDAPAPAMEAPAAILRAVASSLAPRPKPPTPPTPTRPRPFELGALGSFTFLEERVAFGGDLTFAWFPKRPFGLTMRIGGSAGLPRESVHGAASAHTFGGGLGAVASLTPDEGVVSLRAAVGATFQGVWFVARANATGIATAQEDWTALAYAGFAGYLRAGDVFRIHVDADAIAALRPVRATDETTSVTAIAGFGLETRLGVAWAF